LLEKPASDAILIMAAHHGAKLAGIDIPFIGQDEPVKRLLDSSLGLSATKKVKYPNWETDILGA